MFKQPGANRVEEAAEVVPRHHVAGLGNGLNCDARLSPPQLGDGGRRDDRAVPAADEQHRLGKPRPVFEEVLGLEARMGLEHCGLVAAGQDLRAQPQLPLGPLRVVAAHGGGVGAGLRLAQLPQERLARRRVRAAARAGRRRVHQDQRPVAVGSVQHGVRGGDPGAHRMTDEHRPPQSERGDDSGDVSGVVRQPVLPGPGAVALPPAADIRHRHPEAQVRH